MCTILITVRGGFKGQLEGAVLRGPEGPSPLSSSAGPLRCWETFCWKGPGLGLFVVFFIPSVTKYCSLGYIFTQSDLLAE